MKYLNGENGVKIVIFKIVIKFVMINKREKLNQFHMKSYV